MNTILSKYKCIHLRNIFGVGVLELVFSVSLMDTLYVNDLLFIIMG